MLLLNESVKDMLDVVGRTKGNGMSVLVGLWWGWSCRRRSGWGRGSLGGYVMRFDASP